jgi:protease I
VAFANNFLENNKPVAAICHGPQLLIETGKLKDINLTSYPSLQTDLQNAGANWHDKEVVYDKGLITSRGPKDLEAFNKKLLKVLSENNEPEEQDAAVVFKYSQAM